MYAIDLHVHTTFSPCSCLTIEELLREARQKGLYGVCITDHETLAAREIFGPESLTDDLLVVVGLEYHTSVGDFVVLGTDEAPPSGLDPFALQDFVRTYDGLLIAVHPFRNRDTLCSEIFGPGPERCFLAEGVNGRNKMEENLKALRELPRLGVKLVAGSDAHSVEELGRFPTYFKVPPRNTRELIKALRSQQFTIAPHLALYQEHVVFQVEALGLL